MATERSPSQTWRQEIESPTTKRRKRMYRRCVIVLVNAGLLGLLLYLLVPPFFAPKTNVILIGTGYNRNYQSPFIPFVNQDHDAFTAVEGIVVHDHREAWTSRWRSRGLADIFESVDIAQNDSLVIYLTAHGIVDAEGNALLLFDDFDLKDQDETTLVVGDLLAQITEFEVAQKILILNAGEMDYDPRMGIIANDFPQKLKECVDTLGDPSLWVICSHQSIQVSQVSHAFERSLFSLFITEGFKGAADFDQDGSVDLEELFSFTSNNVSNWAKQISAGLADQNPVLMHGDNQGEASDLQLVRLAPSKTPYRFDVDALLAPVSLTNSLVVNLPADNRVTGVLRRTASKKSVESGSELKGSSGEPTGDKLAGSKDPGQMDVASEESTNPESSVEAPKDQASVDSVDQANVGGKQNDSAHLENMESRRLLRSAWLDSDKFASQSTKLNPFLNPVQNWPHIWHEYQFELSALERQLRSGLAIDSSLVNSILKSTNLNSPGIAPTSSSIENLWPPTVESRQESNIVVPTIALAEFLFGDDVGRVGLDSNSLFAALEAENEQAIINWIQANQTSDTHHYQEIRFITKLLEVTEAKWELKQKVALTCLAGERVAALGFFAPGWGKETIEEADAWRFSAEALFFDQTGADWQSDVATGLDRAVELYETAERNLTTVLEAQRLRDTSVMQVRSWVHLQQRISGRTGQSADPEGSVLLAFLEHLNLLNRELSPGGDYNFPRLQKNLNDLLQLKAVVESEYGPDFVLRNLAASSPEKGISWLGEQYLYSPFLPLLARESLVSSVDQVGRDLSKYLTVSHSNATPTHSDASSTGSFDWINKLIVIASLESELAKLFHDATDAKTADGIDVEIKNHLDAMKSASDQLTLAYESENHQSITTAEKKIFKELRHLGASVASIYQRSLEGLATENARANCGSSGVESRLRMLDPRDAWRFQDLDIASVEFDGNLQWSLAWHQSRHSKADLYANGSRLQSDVNSGRSSPLPIILRSEASTSINPPTIETRVGGTRKINLQKDSCGLVSMSLLNQGQNAIYAFIAVGFDGGSIEVSPEVEVSSEAGQVPTIAFDDSQSLFADQDFASVRSGKITNIIELSPSVETTVDLTIKRKKQSTQSSVLTLDVYGVESEVKSDSYCPKLLNRERLEVHQPVAELFIRQMFADNSFADLYADNENGVALHAFPNRVNDFKVGLQNNASIHKKVSLAIYPENREGALAGNESYQDLINGVTPLIEYQYDLVPGGTGFPIPKMPEKATEPKVAETIGEQSADPQEVEPDPVDLPHGLIVEIKDTETGQVDFCKLACGVKRPRRYVSPEVSYDAYANRIKVSLNPVDEGQMPNGKPIRVQAYLPGSSAAGVTGKASCVLASPTYRDRLSLELPSPPPTSVRLDLEVDGYPRAFSFEVFCDRSSTEIPELTELKEVRVRTRDDQVVFGETSSIPVELSVDAPVGSFENGDDTVSVSLQADANGLMRNTPLITLDTDRSFKVGYKQALPDGTLHLISDVSDFQVEVASVGLRNMPLKVLGQMELGGELVKQDSQLVMIDTSPPFITNTSITPAIGFASTNATVDMVVSVWDEDSIVKQLEAAFDLDGSGKFPATGIINQSEILPNGQWKISVPTGAEPGEKMLLIRATDEVGNSCEPFACEVLVLSQNDTDAMILEQTVELTGTVSFRGEMILNADLDLSAVGEIKESSQPRVTAKTDEKGRFMFTDIPPGQYQLKARGVLRNRVRLTEIPVNIEPGPKRTVSIEVPIP